MMYAQVRKLTIAAAFLAAGTGFGGVNYTTARDSAVDEVRTICAQDGSDCDDALRAAFDSGALNGVASVILGFVAGLGGAAVTHRYLPRARKEDDPSVLVIP